MASKIEVIIGTYEEFLLGYKLEESKMQQTFADKSHSGTLKCTAVNGHWVATGATDDRIFVYDMRNRKQSQIVLSHSGTINTLAFTPDGTHLLSGADDGHMICTRLNTWITEANWKKAHNGAPVTHISCHPSGKLALSLGGDLVLRTWNLVKGRVAYKTNLKSRGTLGFMPDCLSWSPTGDYFSLSGQRVVEIWSIQLADVLQSKKTASKPVSICWIADEICLIGLEDGKIQWVQVNVETEKDVLIQAHSSRVKAMSFLKDTLVTAASTGEIKMWQVDEARKKLKELAVAQTGCRPTCLGLLDLEQFGENYLLSKTIAAAIAEDLKKPLIEPNKHVQPTRSVVTIEYEDNESKAEDANSEDEEEEDSGDSPIDEENDADSIAGESSESTENSSDDETNKPAKPSSSLGKRKQQTATNKQKPAKQGKFNKQEQKKSKPQTTQPKKSKLKGK